MKIYTLFVIVIYLKLLRADISIVDVKKYSGLGYRGEGYIYPFPEQCSEILNAFAQYASNFTMCSIQFARPIRLCEKCIDHYLRFFSKYKELKDTVVNGTSCRSLFISHDRLDAVADYYNNILAVWTKGHCNECYKWNGETPELSNETKHFNKMFEDTMNCITSHPNSDTKKICDDCKLTYIQMDEYYRTLSTDSVGVDKICMDIVDSMNATRSIWSKSLNCCQLRRTPEIVFLCCTGIISLLPFLYYLALRYCGPIRDLPNVLKQSRFKQTILRSIERND